MSDITAAQSLVACLAAHGVDRAFCVPGESYMSVLDALLDRNDVDLVTCRHESGAGFMAVADAKITGRPGVCFVSRGPGATNASIAVHTAEQDAAPMVLFIGQVARRDIGRGAFQEIDYERAFGGMAKGVWTIHDPDQLPEVVARAFRTACTGTPGPTVVVLPEDMLTEATAAPVVEPLGLAESHASAADIDRAAALLAESERPLMIVGGGVDNADGREALRAAAERYGIPVATSFKRQDLFDNASPLYAGHLGFGIPKAQVDLYRDSDLVLAVGTRLGDTSTQGFSFPQAPRPAQPLIHVYDDPAQVGRNYATDLGLACDPAAFLDGLAGREPGPAAAARAAWAARLNGYTAGMREWVPPEALDMGHVVAALGERLDDDAVLITDGGNFSSWLHRYFCFGPNHLLVGAVAGAMGLGMPAAVAAGLRLAGRQIVVLIGDGGFLMTGNELATAVQRNLPIRAFVSNNGSYGTIRLHQEKAYPGRISGTELTNPDFAALADAFGAKGLTIARPEDAGPVVAEALAHPGPVVVDVHTDLEQISAFVSLTDLAK